MKLTSRLAALMVAITLVTSIGCQRSRMLSRKDYTTMQDPFMDPPVAAQNESGGSGFARLDDTGGERSGGLPSQRPIAGTAQPLAGGPKPLGSERSTSSVSSSSMVQATYPTGTSAAPVRSAASATYPGPALSDFLGPGKSQAAPATAASSATAATGTSADLNDFARFLDENEPTTIAAETTPSSPIASAAGRQPDFSQWMDDQQKHWNADAATTAKSVDATPSFPLGAATDLSTLPAFSSGTAVQRTAGTSSGSAVGTPAGQNPFASVAETQPAAASSRSQSLAVSPAGADPFVNPFATSPGDVNSSPEPNFDDPRSADPSTGETLDSTFRMDTGWKPAHMEAR